MASAPTEITLSSPISLGEKEHHKLTVRQPKAGDMRGLKTADILQMDINAFAALLPRICVSPVMNQTMFYDLEPANLTAIQVAIVDFFVTADA